MTPVSILPKILSDMDRLEPMPQVTHQLLRLLDDPDVPLSEFAEIIAHDPALTTNLLKTVNSSFFGLSRRVDSIHDAVIYLGLNQIVEICLMQNFTTRYRRGQSGYGLAKGDLWKQSICSALLSKLIGPYLNIKRTHQVFTAGLIKDIGKIILNQYVVHFAAMIDRCVKEKGMAFNDAEKSLLGIDHASLGALMARKWLFSDKLCDIIEFHHDPLRAAFAGAETAIVYLSDQILTDLGVHQGIDIKAYAVYDEVLERYDLSEKKICAVTASFSTEIKTVEKYYAML